MITRRHAITTAALTAAATLLPALPAAAALSSTPRRLVTTNGSILTMAVLPGSRLALGGTFTQVTDINGKAYPAGNLVVVNKSGTIAHRRTTPGSVRSVDYTDGRLYVSGDGFSPFALNVTGYAKTAWAPPAVKAMAIAHSTGRVYLGCSNGHVYCVDPSSGRVVWDVATTGGPVRSLLAANGRLYVGGLFERVGSFAQHGAVAMSYATGLVDTDFRPQLVADSLSNYDGEGVLSMAYMPNRNRIIMGIGSAKANSISPCNAHTGSRAGIESHKHYTTGDCQTVEVIGDTYLGGWHNQHGGTSNYYGGSWRASDGARTTFDPKLTGSMPIRDGGNGGVQCSAIDAAAGRLYLGGAFSRANGQSMPTLAWYQL